MEVSWYNYCLTRRNNCKNLNLLRISRNVCFVQLRTDGSAYTHKTIPTSRLYCRVFLTLQTSKKNTVNICQPKSKQ